MKYCKNCGAKIENENAVICVNCGCKIQPENEGQSSGLVIVAKILMILSCIGGALFLIPLAWMLPMTIVYFNATKNSRPISTAFKVCTLIFVNPIAGILMLCSNDNN